MKRRGEDMIERRNAGWRRRMKKDTDKGEEKEEKRRKRRQRGKRAGEK